MTADLVFYTNPRSRGRIVRWMLEEVGAPHRVELVPYGPPMQAPEYRAINPMMKVPALRHGASVVTECAAICAYLADAFPEAGLAPARPDRAAYYRWLFFAAGPLEAATTDRRLGFEPPEDKRRMVGYGDYARTLDALESAVSTGGFIAGEAFSAADVFVGSHVGWGLEFGFIEDRPAFRAYWAKVSDRPACRRARELDDAAAAEITSEA